MRFLFEQRALAFNAPPVTGGRAIQTDDAVAGDCDREYVRSTRLRDSPNGAGMADLPGELTIADSLAGRDVAKCLPDALLEGRSAHVQGQPQAATRLLDEPDDGRDETIERLVSSHELRARKPILQVVDERVGFIAEQNRAHTLVGCRDQYRSQRTLPDREADGRSTPAAPERRGRHAEGGGR